MTWFRFSRTQEPFSGWHGFAAALAPRDRRRTPGTQRTNLTLCGISFTHSHYRVPIRQAGSSACIESSWWLSSGRAKLFGRERGFSFGWGVTQDWAQVQYLEINIGGSIYASENGQIEFRPPIKATPAKTVDTSFSGIKARTITEDVQIAIENRSDVPASGVYVVYRQMNYSLSKDSPSIMTDQAEKAESFRFPSGAGYPFLVPAHGRIERGIPMLAYQQIASLTYWTVPQGPKRRQILRGRPEWFD